MNAAPNISGTRNSRSLANIDSMTRLPRPARRPHQIHQEADRDGRWRQTVAIPTAQNTFTISVRKTTSLIPAAAHPIKAR